MTRKYEEKIPSYFELLLSGGDYERCALVRRDLAISSKPSRSSGEHT